MDLFSLKGRTGYSKIDVMAWAKQLQRFDQTEIERAFSQVIRRPGFLDIAEILGILDPAEPKEAMALITWERLIDQARAGGQVPEREREAVPYQILKILGGMDKLRTCANEFTLYQMKKNFIDIYVQGDALAAQGRRKLPGGLQDAIKKLSGGMHVKSAIQDRSSR